MARIVLALMGTTFALVLAACGGGGGGGEDTSPPKKVEITVLRTPAPEVVSNDFVAPDVTFGGELVVAGATSVTLILEPTCAGMKLPATTETLGVAGGVFSVRSKPPLSEGTMCEVAVRAIASGASGAGTERSYVLKVHVAAKSDTVPAYRSVAIAAYDGNPVVLSRTAPFVHAVENRTGLSGQWGMALGEAPTKDGYILILSRWFSESSAFRVTKIDPTTRVQTAYTGVLPPGYEFSAGGDSSTWTWGPKWHWCMNQGCPQVYGGPWGTPPDGYFPATWASDGEGGYFYAPGDNSQNLWHVDSTQVHAQLMAGDTSGVLKLFIVMYTYSHTPATE